MVLGFFTLSLHCPGEGRTSLLVALESLTDLAASPLPSGVPATAPGGYADCCKLLHFKPGSPSKDSDVISLGDGSCVLVF